MMTSINREFFISGQNNIKLSDLGNEKEDEHSYPSHSQLATILKKFLFNSVSNGHLVKDPWKQINEKRHIVQSAIDEGLSALIAKHRVKKCPIVEIGSARGYTLSKEISSTLIRIQPAFLESQLLQNEGIPTYQLSAEHFYAQVKQENKKLPLIFAINVFDTMRKQERQDLFSSFNELQHRGNRFLILLDSNPYLEKVFESLESKYPGYSIFPYLPLKQTHEHKFSVVLIPSERIPKLSIHEFIQRYEEGIQALLNGEELSKEQQKLYKWQKKYHFQVILPEELFQEEVSEELQNAGYDVRSYYYSCFKIANLPKQFFKMNEIKGECFYKSVTDSIPIRQWFLNDSNFVKKLGAHPLFLSQLNEEMCKILNVGRKRLLAAEFLVIEATKR